MKSVFRYMDAGVDFRIAKFEYNPALDGLRAVAVAGVFVFHTAKSWAPGGGLGVDMFFVLSGFLITTLLLQERLRTGRVLLRSFYSRRALRLLPAVLAMLLSMGFWSLTLPAESAAVLRQEMIAAFLYVYNFGEDFGILSSDPNVNGYIYHFWSLAVEEQFYLVWPPLFMLLLRQMKGLAGMATLAVTLLCIPIARIWPWLPAANLFGMFSFHGEIVFGCLTALVYNRWILGEQDRLATILALASLIGAIGSLTLFLVKAPTTGLSHVSITVLSAMLTVGLVGNPRSLTAKVLSWRPLVAVGIASYGVYLWHLPVREWCRVYILPHWPLGDQMYLCLLAACTAVVAFASYRLIEQPALRMKDRLYGFSSGSTTAA